MVRMLYDVVCECASVPSWSGRYRDKWIVIIVLGAADRMDALLRTRVAPALHEQSRCELQLQRTSAPYQLDGLLVASQTSCASRGARHIAGRKQSCNVTGPSPISPATPPRRGRGPRSPRRCRACQPPPPQPASRLKLFTFALYLSQVSRCLTSRTNAVNAAVPIAVCDGGWGWQPGGGGSRPPTTVALTPRSTPRSARGRVAAIRFDLAGCLMRRVWRAGIAQGCSGRGGATARGGGQCPRRQGCGGGER